MAQNTFFMFAPTNTFPFKSITEVEEAFGPRQNLTAAACEAIKTNHRKARTLLASMGGQEVRWSMVVPLMDKIDDIFRKVLTSKNDEIDMRLMIGMEDEAYHTRMGDYFDNLKELLQATSDTTWRLEEKKQKLVADALLCKLEYLRQSTPRWPLCTKSAVIALVDSLGRMPNGIKEVSCHVPYFTLMSLGDEGLTVWGWQFREPGL